VARLRRLCPLVHPLVHLLTEAVEVREPGLEVLCPFRVADDDHEERVEACFVLRGWPEDEGRKPERLIDVLVLRSVRRHRIGMVDAALVAMDTGPVEQKMHLFALRAEYMDVREPLVQ